MSGTFELHAEDGAREVRQARFEQTARGCVRDADVATVTRIATETYVQVFDQLRFLVVTQEQKRFDREVWDWVLRTDHITLTSDEVCVLIARLQEGLRTLGESVCAPSRESA